MGTCYGNEQQSMKGRFEFLVNGKWNENFKLFWEALLNELKLDASNPKFWDYFQPRQINRILPLHIKLKYEKYSFQSRTHCVHQTFINKLNPTSPLRIMQMNRNHFPKNFAQLSVYTEWKTDSVPNSCNGITNWEYTANVDYPEARQILHQFQFRLFWVARLESERNKAIRS